MAVGVEIERKFLITKKPVQKPDRVCKIKQGYIARENGNTVRVREIDGLYILSIKTRNETGGRNEFEYDISKEEGEVLFSSVKHPAIIKTRENYKIEDKIWELDIFEGANTGLIIAEVELSSLDETVAIPDWVGPEVTELSKFYNANIAGRPFESWRINYEALVKRLSD